MKQSLGSFLKLTVSGASHAPEMTFRLENFPGGFRIDAEALRAFMERRAPGRDRYSTARRETDEIEFRAGLRDGVTTGAPIEGAIANRDMRPGDYGAERTIPRPGHADFGQWIVTGRIPTGGGANSGRLTAPVCAAGGICREWLRARGITVAATLAEVGGVTGAKAMLAEIDRARRDGDSVGGRVHCTVANFPAGVGGALWDGLESGLSSALFAIPGVKGVTFGDVPVDAMVAIASAEEVRPSALMRLRQSRLRGSSSNDAFRMKDGAVVPMTNRAGGILGGRASGAPIEFDVFLKPTPTIFKPQRSVDLKTMTNAICEMKGRHDPCIARRAVPVVEAMASFALADALLADEAAHPRICLTLTGRTLGEDVEQYRSQRYFTDLVELRVDLLTAKERARAAEFPKLLWQASRPGPVVPVIFTYRRKSDGGAFAGGEGERRRFFKRLASRVSSLKSPFSSRVSCLATSPEGEGVRHETRDASGDARRETCASIYFDFEDDFSVPALESLARAKGIRIIRSRHDFGNVASLGMSSPGGRGRPPGGPQSHDGKTMPNDDCGALGDRALPSGLFPTWRHYHDLSPAAFRRNAPTVSADEIAKLAFLPRDLKDVSNIFLRTYKTRSSAVHLLSPPTFSLIIAMGAQGLASRVLAARLGAPWTYASVGGLGEIGHVSPETLVRDYRFRSVTRAAALYGVTGWPLKATRSPELHNAMFASEERDALMIPFPAKTARGAIGFMNAMGMKGLAVTIPHKETVMPLLDRIDPEARRVGAVNTVVREGKRLVGYNTDVAGFAEAIGAFVDANFCSRPEEDDMSVSDAIRRSRLRGMRAAVMGAGGASKAVVFALKKLGVKVTVYGRHRPRRKSDPHFANCGSDVARDFDLIVNATPVDPIPEYRFTGRELVYDLVYVPAETPLLARARAAGCRCENGFSMLLAQARGQQRLFARAART